ncbi:helix-turn-helix transcriptional regulator [Arcicella sp. LKC2W]|uniref:helix-turn-helix domain-containing protein n=1 Tax=Arcicella sp. LKC2W TaxID=2984198 RepID=UPI002B1EF92E|nr:helix-turn-helix transcriptional regulator [Arcicella sp. LKC2W]MEA5459281.1 helix-turn-helix transcriptional regulator [Arcicella sp. LKC2W]
MKKTIQTPTFEKRITIRNFRKLLNVKQEILAPVMQVSQSTLSRMENEDKELNAEQVEKLIKSLGIKPEDILKHEGNMVLIGNNFKQIKEVNYKQDTSEEELNLSKIVITELREEIKELKAQNTKHLQQIQRLFEMLEVKHHTMN